MAILKVEHRQDPIDLTSLEDIGATIDPIADDFKSKHQHGFSKVINGKSCSYVFLDVLDLGVVHNDGAVIHMETNECLVSIGELNVEAGVDFAQFEVNVA